MKKLLRMLWMFWNLSFGHSQEKTKSLGIIPYQNGTNDSQTTNWWPNNILQLLLKQPNGQCRQRIILYISKRSGSFGSVHHVASHQIIVTHSGARFRRHIDTPIDHHKSTGPPFATRNRFFPQEKWLTRKIRYNRLMQRIQVAQFSLRHRWSGSLRTLKFLQISPLSEREKSLMGRIRCAPLVRLDTLHHARIIIHCVSFLGGTQYCVCGICTTGTKSREYRFVLADLLWYHTRHIHLVQKYHRIPPCIQQYHWIPYSTAIPFTCHVVLANINGTMERYHWLVSRSEWMPLVWNCVWRSGGPRLWRHQRGVNEDFRQLREDINADFKEMWDYQRTRPVNWPIDCIVSQ